MLPRPGRAADHAHRAHRRDDARDRGPDLSGRAPHEIGLGLQSDKRPGDYARLGALAERLGFDVVTVYQDLTFQPSLPALLEIAAATSRIRLGASCLNPYTLHPVEIAGQLAALDAASGGRAYLGLAKGAWLDALGIDQTRPLTRLREAWEVVLRLLAGDASGFEGEVFRLAPGLRLAYEPLRAEPPLLVGTWGPRTARAAAAMGAAEVKIGGSSNPDMVRRMHEWLDGTGVRVVAGAICVVDDDRAAARAKARFEAALYLPVVAALDPTVELPDGLVERMDTLLAAGDQAGAGALIPDDLLDRFGFAGTPEDVAAQTAALLDAGAARVELGTPHGISDHAHGIELLGTRALPLLR